jgi:NIMA-interacting peptidyl-prolyl cis-trans isomerase 1
VIVHLARSLVAVPFLAIACGGAAPTGGAKGPDGATTTSESPCLTRANASYERKPDEPRRIGVRHVLVRHAESKNPGGATRTRVQACERALEARKKLESGADWDEVVKEYSDEKGAAERHGSLGSVTRGDLDPAFAAAAFSLGVDETSYVVESKAGFHLIRRTE